MNNRTIVFTSVLLLLTTTLAAAEFSHTAHAATTGVVCILPAGGTSCPSSPETITGTAGSQLTISVFISGSAGLNGFDVILLANSTILKPTSFSLNGTVLLGTPQIFAVCFSGVLIHGSACSQANNVNTVEVSAGSAPGQPNTISPTTGLLFTMTYNVTQPATIPIGFQTSTQFCSNSSVAQAGAGDVCVSVASPPSPTAAPETVQTAVFSTSPVPDFGISANPSSLPIKAGASATSVITVSSINGFNGIVSLSATFAPSGPVATLSSTSIAGGSGTSTLTITTTNGTITGSYTVTVTGTSGTLSHAVTISVTVSTTQQGDFTISDSATSIAIPEGSERQTIVTVTSVNGFSGSVQLVAAPSSKAFACWFTTLTNTSTVSVPSGGSAQQFPTCAAGGTPGSYTLTITGTSGALRHSTSLGVNVTDFQITAPTLISFTPGITEIEGLTFYSLAGFAGTISISVNSPSALSTSCPATVTLSSGNRMNANCTINSSTPGSYNVTFTGTFVCSDCYFNGKDAHSVSTIVNVVGPPPDFSLTASPSAFAIGNGLTVSSTITITGLNGFGGIVNLSATSSNPNVIVSISPASITLSSGGSATATVTITASNSAPAGIYSITITGASGSLAHSTTLSVTVTGPPDFTITVSPTNQTISKGASATFTVTITGTNDFNNTVSLSATISPAAKNGPKASLPATVGPYSQSTLTVTTQHSTPTGSYTITITATSGSLTHSFTITVIVTK